MKVCCIRRFTWKKHCSSCVDKDTAEFGRMAKRKCTLISYMYFVFIIGFFIPIFVFHSTNGKNPNLKKTLRNWILNYPFFAQQLTKTCLVIVAETWNTDILRYKKQSSPLSSLCQSWFKGKCSTVRTFRELGKIDCKYSAPAIHHNFRMRCQLCHSLVLMLINVWAKQRTANMFTKRSSCAPHLSWLLLFVSYVQWQSKIWNIIIFSALALQALHSIDTTMPLPRWVMPHPACGVSTWSKSIRSVSPSFQPNFTDIYE